MFLELIPKHVSKNTMNFGSTIMHRKGGVSQAIHQRHKDQKEKTFLH